VDALEDKANSISGSAQKKLWSAAQVARNETNLWNAFEILQANLGPASYRDEIRQALAPAATAGVPAVYSHLCDLRISGILSLNLDRLAGRALQVADRGQVVEHTGRDMARLMQVLSEPTRFAVNLHGSVENTASWVFTTGELNRLLADEVYRQFMVTILTTRTVIFVGITADDLAIGGHLESLSRLGVETPTHYWLTDRLDPGTDFWAEHAGVRVIRYNSAGGDHSAVIDFIEDLRTAEPEEPELAPPVRLERLADAASVPSVGDLVNKDAEEIRLALNAYATTMLSDDSAEAYEAYDKFAREYDQAIYRAWYTSANEGSNELLGYTLQREAARGAFGRVYEATAPDGSRVAVKVLLEDIRTNPDLLRSFRRGVRSMRILSERDVLGMVRYVEASEIPAFAVMDWVDGPNLADAKAAGYLDDWRLVLRVARDVTAVIQRAHELPERVLHRDIRPSNVMLKDYYLEPDNLQVVVLDFDLSWHRNSAEVSVLHSTAAGYLAPEQIRRRSGASTQNAAVDSFGLGMTFLFLCSGEDPLPDQHLHEKWEAQVAEACGRFGPAAWKSTAARFSRLILACTRDRQSARPDGAEILAELQRLHDCVENPTHVSNADLLAEEIAAHAVMMEGYDWDSDRLKAERRLPTGLQCVLSADLQNERVRVDIEWSATGVEERGNLFKYASQGARTAEARLKSRGWAGVEYVSGAGAAYVSGHMATEALIGRAGEFGRHLDSALEQLRFGA
jgi:serine/threonine protein kinase